MSDLRDKDVWSLEKRPFKTDRDFGQVLPMISSSFCMFRSGLTGDLRREIFWTTADLMPDLPS